MNCSTSRSMRIRITAITITTFALALGVTALGHAQSDKSKPDKEAIRPFRVNVPDEALADLRRRLVATRWPDKETVADRSQGVQLAKQADRGGHFAAWEYPEVFATELRAAFRSLRSS